MLLRQRKRKLFYIYNTFPLGCNFEFILSNKLLFIVSLADSSNLFLFYFAIDQFKFADTREGLFAIVRARDQLTRI